MQELASAAVTLESGGHDRLLARIGDARFVLFGQATHGTDEFYRERAEVTRRLLEGKGFDAVAIEADWPDAHHASMEIVVDLLERIDPDAAACARERYAALEHVQMGVDGAVGVTSSSEKQVTEELLELRARALEAMRHDDPKEEEQLFQIAQNARLVKGAEAYYRSMLTNAVDAWNLRSRHMADTLVHIDRTTAVESLEKRPQPAEDGEPAETYPSGV